MPLTAIYGREREFVLGDGFLESVGGGFGVLRLEGEAGIGKTTVWREVARRGAERGYGVLSCRPAETETKLALSALADLLEPVPGAAVATLPGPQRRAIDVALLRAEPDTASLDPRTLGTAVRTLLAGLSAEAPLLIAIDDVQWLDAASASVLEFAMRRLGEARLGWLLALRVPEPARLANDGHVTRVALGPLTLGALHHLVKDDLDQALTRPTLVRVHEASAGNPLFALEIARELDSADRGPRVPVPVSLRELLASRIPKLPAGARDALLAAAALSQPTPALVERAASPAGLAAAEGTGLVRVEHDQVTFAHPLYASAVLDSASHARLRELHLRLARLVTDPEAQARHLAVATTEPDEQVAEGLEHAAALARSRGAWESAAELLAQARRLTPPERGDEALRRGIAAAEHDVHAGDRSRARALLEPILATPLPRALRADALRLLAEISYNDGDAAEALRLFSEALEQADDPRLATRIELGLAYLNGHAADPPGGAVHAYRALARAKACGDEPLAATALAMCAMYDYLCGSGVDWDKVDRSLATDEPAEIMPLLVRPSLTRALLLLYVGRHAEARDRLTAVWTAASERGDESDLGFVLLWLSWLETRIGDFATALALADEAASVAALTGSHSTLTNVVAQQALVHAHRGDVAGTRRDCAEAAALVERHENSRVGVWIAAALGLLELSLGDAEAAWRVCEPATEAIERHGIAEPTLVFFVPEALEALIATDRLDRAEALLGTFEARGRELDRAWALATAGRCRGLLLAARGDVPAAAAALEGSLAEHERLDMPFERARTLLAQGAIERRARRRAKAKQSFEQALESFERIGARLWAERARDEMGRLGLRRSGAELTVSERRVAELAAQGHTNREVAAALFVSPKTVEATLARVYRKLGIASRAELGARMLQT